MNSSDIDMLHRELNRSGEWTVVNKMKLNPVQNKRVSFKKLE